MEKKQKGQKCTSTFTKRIGNTTYRVNVHFAEDTTDTVEDKLLHLMGTVALRERTTAASDLIRMAERAGADARANDAASGAVIKDSQTGRAYREAERERQDSERQRKIKARKRGIDR